MATIFCVSLIFSGWVAATAIKASLDDQQNDQIHLVLDQQYEACLRGNYLRRVVYANTRAAVAQARQLGQAQSIRLYSRDLAILRSTPYIDLRTGAIDCDRAVPIHP